MTLREGGYSSPHFWIGKNGKSVEREKDGVREDEEKRREHFNMEP